MEPQARAAVAVADDRWQSLRPGPLRQTPAGGHQLSGSRMPRGPAPTGPAGCAAARAAPCCSGVYPHSPW
jgi:hypothetical protein